MYPKTYRTLFRHWMHRFVFVLLGIIWLYAPFAVLTRLILILTDSPLIADAHRICLRMPIQWLAQPWMYSVMIEQPAYLVAVLVLPLLALVLGPLFCGWMCPAGHLPEFLSRLVPPRFQIDLAGKVNPTYTRYGFTVGFMAVSLIGGNVCCSFCNFTHTQNIISAVFGSFLGISYWTSFSVISFLLWLVVLGLFTKGGRGWCNFLCPAGALMGLFHSIGSWLGIGRSMRIDASRCKSCKTCIPSCSSWAISVQNETVQIDSHACNVCMDCAQVCPNAAIGWRAAMVKPAQKVQPMAS